MLILSVLILGVALLTRQNLLGSRLKTAIENRMLASVAADSVLGVVATMPVAQLCGAVHGAGPVKIHDKAASGFDWLQGWEVPSRVANLRLHFRAFSIVPRPAPTPDEYAIKSSFSCPSPPSMSGVHVEVKALVDYTRDAGTSWQTLESEKWIPAP
jgi:hypothetical protein